MLSSFFQPCEVKLHLLQNVLFVHPSASPHPALAHAQDGPPSTEDELVRGLVELRVPSDRHTGGIRVRLRGMEMIAILDLTTLLPVSWDERVILDKTLEVGVPSGCAAGRSRSRVSASRTPSRAPSQAPSRAPSQPASRAGSPSRTNNHFDRRGSTDSETEDRGRTSSRSANCTHRDVSVGTGLASALAVAMRGRSSSRATVASGTRSASKASRPPSPGAASRNRGSSRTPSSHPPAAAARPVSSLIASHTVPGRQRMSPRTGADDHAHEEGARGRSPGVGFFGRGATSSRSRALGSELRHHIPSQLTVEESPEGLEEAEATEGEGMFLSKGVHAFEFAFILSSDIPPYERSAYGRVRYMVKATVLGGGRAKSNVDTVREIFPMAVPSVDSPSTPLTVMYHDWHPSLGGVLSIACTANSISVGGIFNIDVHSPDSPQDLIVYQVRVMLETQVDLYTSKKGRQTARLRPARLFERGHAPQRPSEMDSPATQKVCVRWSGTENSWSVQGLARIPDDNTTRPSTLPGSKADVRFSHQLLVEVMHSRDPVLDGHSPGSKRKLKVYALRQPVVIPSCCVAFNAVTLPRYEEKDSTANKISNMYRVPEALLGDGSLPTQSPWSVAAAPLQATGHDQCVCGMSIADLEAKEANMLPQNPEYNVPVNEVRSRGKIGEYAPVDDAAQWRAGPSRTAPVSPSAVTPTPSPPRSRSGSEQRPSMHRSASSPAVRKVRHSGHPVHVLETVDQANEPSAHDGLIFRSNRTRDNLSSPIPSRSGLPNAPIPGGSGQVTPTPALRSRSQSRARQAHPDLSEAIPRLNALRETVEQDALSLRYSPPPPPPHRGLPPAYDSLT